MPYRIVPRSEAGLLKPRRSYGKMKLPVGEVWVHHSVTPQTSDPFKDWRVVQNAAFGRGFADISYSFGFHPDGTILEGRGDGVGAHTEGHNSTSYGLVLIGNYELREPTREQIDAVRWWVKWAKDSGRLRIAAYPTGGHRDLDATACPGKLAYPKIPEMRVAWSVPAPTPPPAPREGIVAVNRPPIRILTHPAWPEQEPGKTPYLVVTDDGGVFNFGGAPFYGSLGGVALNRPIVDAVVTPSGAGYILMGADGGIFAFGDGDFVGRVEYLG